jgi:transmembrane sensor
MHILATKKQEKHFAQMVEEELGTPLQSGKPDAATKEKLEKILVNVLAYENENLNTPSGNRILLWRRLKFVSAAAALLLISVMVYWGYNRPTDKQKSYSLAKHDVAPGGDKAVLILSDGSQIVLNSAQNGAIAKQGNTAVLKNNNQLVYDASQVAKNSKYSTLAYNTIITPRGGQYRVTLPDGSKVWLNASSSLKFPTAFTGISRRVEITGEAYFEVKSIKTPHQLTRKTPFIVKANGVEVEVLGTHFNVMAYADEGKITTTLLEGSVKVKRGNANGLLKPGQEAQLSYNQTNDKILIRNGDTDEAVAWKNGRFLFNNTDLKTIMRQVMRWYDVNIIYQDGAPERYFTANLSRNTNLSELLKVFEVSKIHFKIEGKNLIVLP